MDLKASPSKAFDAIPEAYFDVIARLIPGGLFLALLIGVVFPTQILSAIGVLSKAEVGGATLLLVAGVVTAYTCSILLTPLSSQIEGWNFRHFHRSSGRAIASIALLAAEEVGLRPAPDYSDLRYLARAYLRTRDPDGAIQLSKILAEIACLNTMAAGAAVLFMLNLTLNIHLLRGLPSFPEGLKTFLASQCVVVLCLAAALAAARSHLSGCYGKIVDYIAMASAPAPGKG